MFNAERKALQVMGLGTDATLETVKAKYKALVKQPSCDSRFVAHLFQRLGGVFPSPHSITRIAPRQLITGDAQQIRVQCHQTDDQAHKHRDARGNRKRKLASSRSYQK